MATLTTLNTNKPFAEIIESSLTQWVAQSWQWNTFPSFGALVTLANEHITHVALVTGIQTGSSDPSRTPIPYQKTEDELHAEQPQIFAFLKTTFTCVPLGYFDKGRLRYQLPPQPPKIHSFVQTADLATSRQFFAHTQYLHVLFGMSNQIVYMDELLLAILEQQASIGALTQERVITIIETISLLTGNDYRRLKLFLQRAQPIIQSKE
ncbi:MAG: hypothetical protein AB7F19_02440 [Candidatus Babeliales bacterium]